MPVLEISDDLDGGETHDCGCGHNHGLQSNQSEDTHECGHNHDLFRGSTPQACQMCRQDCMKYERYRRNTFATWPQFQNVNKDDLAKNGFYYIGNGTDDRVQCAFCKIILKNWESGDVIEDEHKKHAPLCPFVKDRRHAGNFPLGFGQLPANNAHHRGPIHREYQERELRFSSFHNWPKDKRQTPGELANAGFFYLGYGDSVKCFYCGGMLRHWEDTDDVWTEHMKWFPLCLFVVEHDPATHTNLPHHLRRTISGIALANGYSEETIDNYRKYVDDNGLIHPDEYREFVNQLDQFNQSTNVTFELPQGEVSTQQQNASRSTTNDEQATGDRYLCKVCYQHQVEVIFYPCKHVCCCQECSEKLDNCPVCRKRISGKLQLFFS